MEKMKKMKKMKKKCIAVLAAFFCAGWAFSQTVNLDKAMDDCVMYFGRKLERGTRIRVAQIESETAPLSAYLTEKIRLRFIHDSPFIVSAKDDFLSAQIVLSGSLVKTGDSYCLIVKAFDVKSSRVIARFKFKNIRENMLNF